MFVASLLSPDIANPVATQCQDRENTQNLNSPPLRQPSTSTKDATASTRRQNPYYPYETIGPKTHTHYTRPTTTYWQEIIPTCSVTSLPYSTTPPYQYSFPATLTPETSLLLPIRPLGNTMDDIAVCSLALPHASMTVVKELARILANKIRKFDPEVVMGLPTGGLVLAPFVAEELGFLITSELQTKKGSLTIVVHKIAISHGAIPKKPWYGDDLTTKISCIFNGPGEEPSVYLDPNLLSLIKGKRIALIDDVVSSGTTIAAMLKFLKTEEEKGGMRLNIVCGGVGMLQGDKYLTQLGAEVVEMVVGAVESPLLKAVEGGWIKR
ncbi:hypothetical protein EYC84_007322 [Monilinia fructicola]|uniref:Phosphoribosyltransferase domain-containing protein n=1 Tax=Monilinia fructicola TaxID=38448 RepID=A0A5M9JKM2_MONFR|nr:hypothetical protein EYC84_007322 [Monilinia fructicola]